MDERTDGQPRSNLPLNCFEVGGINMDCSVPKQVSNSLFSTNVKEQISKEDNDKRNSKIK